MHVQTLRERYGENFAAAHADTLMLREIINRLDAPSLNRLQGDLERSNRMNRSRAFTGVGHLTDLVARDLALFRQFDHVYGRCVLAVLTQPAFQAASSFQVCALRGRRMASSRVLAGPTAVAFDFEQPMEQFTVQRLAFRS